MPYCHRPWVWFPRCHRGTSCALPKTGHVQRRGRDQSAAQCGFHRGRVGDPPEVLAGTFFFVSIFIPKEPWNPWDTHSGVIISYCREKSVICSTIRLLAKDMQLTALKVATWLSWDMLRVCGWVLLVRLKNFHIFPSWTTDRLVMMNCKPHRRETLVYGEIIKIYSACRCTCIIMYSPNSWVIIPLFVKRDYTFLYELYI